MSFKYYCHWWIKNKLDLEQLTKKDNAFLKIPEDVKERQIANKLVGGMYAQYCMLVQDLDLCLDQLAQPQKTVTVRKLVEAAVMRLKELYNELRWIDFSEYHYIDDSLVELKLIPHSIEILHPYLSYPRPYDIQEMYERLKVYLKMLNNKPEVVCLSEYWLKPGEEETISVEGYQVISCYTRKESIHGGVCILAENGVQSFDDPPKLRDFSIEGQFENGERIYTKPETPPEENQEQLTEVTAEEVGSAVALEATDTKKGKKKKRSRMQTPLLMDKKVELTPEELEHQRQEAQVEAAIDLIQRHERARQARLYHREVNAIYLMHKEESGPTKPGDKKEYTPEEREKAVRTLQRVYRGHYWRNYLKKREDERRILIGMNETSFRSRKEFEKEEKCIEERRKLRELRIKQYIDAHLAEKERVLRVVGPGLMEDIGDEIREWFYQWYIRAKNFDKIPPEEKGGTILVVRGETMTPEEWIDEVEKKRRSKVKAGGAKAEKAKLKAEKAKKKAAEKAAKKVKMAALKKAMKEKKKRRNDVVNFQMEFDDPGGKELYEEGQKEHGEIWDYRDELLNPKETHYMDLITDQRCYEVQLEMRLIVDEMMRYELELLNAALARDKNKKPKKAKKPKKKKKKKGKKQPKDITAHRTTEEIFQELFDNGIIRLYPKTRLDEFMGDFSFKNYELRNYEFLEPPPCLGDVRQAIVMNCIMPLGLQECKERPRSAIICGPPMSGKRILANAIFTATRCVLFDLSPPVLAGKYPEKPGLAMLVHLIMKMARLLQPSILYIDGAEKTFYKKVPKEEKAMEPKRMGKVLLKKIVKLIKPPDRIMLLGTSNQPWAAAKKMKKVYDKAILIPRSDYGSVYLYWRELLMPYHSVDRNIDLSCLAKLTVNYPLGVIKEVTKKVMVPARIVKLHHRPLTQEELFEPFTKIDPITDKLWKKYQKWYGATPIGKLGKKFTKYKLTLREDLLKQREAEKNKEKKGKKK